MQYMRSKIRVLSYINYNVEWDNKGVWCNTNTNFTKITQFKMRMEIKAVTYSLLHFKLLKIVYAFAKL